MKVLTIGVVAVALLLAGPAAAHKPPNHAPYLSCKSLNAKYPHGVGRWGAKDRDSDGNVHPDGVTNFKRSNVIYKAAMNHNRGLDRDKDLIACEKK